LNPKNPDLLRRRIVCDLIFVSAHDLKFGMSDWEFVGDLKLEFGCLFYRLAQSNSSGQIFGFRILMIELSGRNNRTDYVFCSVNIYETRRGSPLPLRGSPPY
jgi:hypothetical protein